MKRQIDDKRPRKLRQVLWIGAFVAYSVTAAGVMIDAIGDNYRELSQVAQTTVDSPDETRGLGAAQIAAAYRARSGAPFATLPPGSAFQVIWPDGSSEYVIVTSQASGVGVRPIPGTQRPPPEEIAPSGQLQLLPVSSAGVGEAPAAQERAQTR